MKKLVYLGFIFALSLLFVGCNKSNFKDSITIKLDIDPLSGYYWEYEFMDQGLLKIIEDNDIDCNADNTKCTGNQIFTVEGLSEGKTYINFKYIDQITSDVKYVAKYEFEINKDLKLKEKHFGSYYER